jgi:anti-anti-sigma regulatory factor
MNATDTTINLAPVLDLTAADSLKQELLTALAISGEVAIDAGQVQRVSSPCLQVLAAAAQRNARVTNASAAFRETAEALDLAAVLGLGNANV